ncbi:MAG TPA: murein biosynthesis integral membrane protein MurJ [Candidatus Solibacter sp.]|nr:murein biosynthesis integral membrane protein MurJ [Candidatus Solibacter sp.]
MNQAGTDERRLITASGTLLLVAFAITKAAGYLQKVVIAHRFGTSGDMDLYVLSFTIPDIFLFLVIGGAVSSAFVPVVTQRLARGDGDAARNVVNGVMTAALLILVLGVGLLELISPLAVHILAGGRGARDQELTLTLTRVILLQALFLGMGGFAVGVMNAYRRFLPLSLAPLMYDLAIIGAALFLTQLRVGGRPLGVVGLAIGVAAGGLAHFAVQVPSLLRIGWRPAVPRALRDPAVWRVAVLTIPIALGLVAVQANIAVDRALAARLPAGRVAALDFANDIAQIPNLTFTTALTLVMFPYFARHAALGELGALRRQAALAVRLNLFVLLPSAVGLIVLGPPIIALLLQRGAFTAGSTQLVTAPLALFAVGIGAQASIFLVARVYYSLQNVVTPMLVAFASVVVNLVATLLLIGPLQAGGLALATSLASTFNLALLIYLLRPALGGFEGRRLAAMLGEVAIGCALLAGVAYLTWRGIAGGGPVRLDARHYIAMLAAIVLSGAAYMASQRLFRSPEAEVAMSVVLRRRAATRAAQAVQ